MKRKGAGLLVISGLMFLFTISLIGTTFAAQKTLEITSSFFRIDYSGGIAYYEGNVKAVWEDAIMEADEMQIFLTEENALEKIVAKGNVKVIQKKEKRQAGAEMATYIAEDDKFVLEGKARYYDESGNSLLAEKIIIWIGAEKLEAEGTPIKATYILGKLKEGETGGSTGGEFS